MNKRYFYTLLTLFFILLFYFKEPIKIFILSEFNQLKYNLKNIYQNIVFHIDIHINQANQIKKLTLENKEYINYISKVAPILNNCEKLKEFKKIKNPNVIFTQTISYANLPDITSIYISFKDNNITHPKGLIYNNLAAGIVIKGYKNFSLALLNSNAKTSYTVFIGKNKIPGILFGGKTITLKYIPKYKKININDLVITSGLDNIFYEGVKVGVITSITQKKLYQEATIKPFYNSYHPSFFYVVNF